MECRKGLTLVRSIATRWLERQNFVFIASKTLLRRTHRTYPLGMYRSAPLVYSGIVDLAISSSENEKARSFLCVLNRYIHSVWFLFWCHSASNESIRINTILPITHICNASDKKYLRKSKDSKLSTDLTEWDSFRYISVEL